jgi:hypothetical protein
MPWKNVKVRADLHEMVARRARQETRSVAQMTDRLLMRALEQETKNLSVDGEAHRGTAPLVPTSSPARAPEWVKPPPAPKNVGETRRYWPKSEVEKIIEGQTTVDEMLASCPNCAGEMQDYCLDDGRGGGEMVKRCEDCGYVREST